MNKLLLVEDNDAIIQGLRYTLTQAHFDVDICTSAKALSEKLETTLYDVAVLDIMLPDGSGYAICKELKSLQPDTPVIFLTAKDDENDVVYGFDLGADDYIVKPFRNRELISRIQNVLRRYNKNETVISVGNVRLDLEASRVYRDGEAVTVTALEYKIIVLLFQNRGKTVTRERILERIWDYAGNVVNDNTLTVYIRRIRQKLGDDVIRTVKGIGYRVECE